MKMFSDPGETKKKVIIVLRNRVLQLLNTDKLMTLKARNITFFFL